MHAKVLVVDELWCVLGTTNIDNRSFEHNDEVNVAMRDRALAARLLEDYARDIEDSQEITLDRWQRRAAWEKSSARSSGFWSASSERTEERAASCRCQDRDLQHPPLPRHGSPDTAVTRRRGHPRIERRRRRPAGGHRRRTRRSRTGRGDRCGRRHGVGDDFGAPPAEPPVRQRGAEPVSDRASQSVPTCRGAPASRARVSGRTWRSRGTRCNLQRPPRHRRARTPLPGDAPGRVSCTTAASKGPKIILGDFNEWMRGLATRRSARCSRASTSTST